jgi:hypothetical protein
MWRRIINEIESDPELRGRYQCWVFSYPTGNPVVYSALRLREDLEKARKLYGLPRGFVLVRSQQLGGLVSRMQVTTMDLAAWDRIEGATADRLFNGLPRTRSSIGVSVRTPILRLAGCLHLYAASWQRSRDRSNRHHRLGPRRSSRNRCRQVKNSMGDALEVASGYPHRMPNGVTGLSPRSPPLRVMDKLPVRAPHHTILGDRGKREFAK